MWVVLKLIRTERLSIFLPSRFVPQALVSCRILTQINTLVFIGELTGLAPKVPQHLQSVNLLWGMHSQLHSPVGTAAPDQVT